MSRAVSAVSAVAVGVAVGFVAGPWAGIAVGASMLAGSMQKPPGIDGVQSSQQELKQIVRSSKEPARYAFGRIGTGALLAWAQEQPGDQTEGERLYMVYVLTEGEIEALEEIYVNQEPSGDAGNLFQYELITDPTEVNQYLLDNSPDWQETQIGRGLSFVRVTLRYDPDFYAAGIPELLFQFRGRNDIYDPRDETEGYSDNVALVILWYVRHRLGVPDDEILWDSFVDAANICDEMIETPAGTFEPRYTMGGAFKADERKDRVLRDLEAACAGTLIRIGGKFGLQVGAYYGPYELEIEEDMVIGAVSGQTEVSRADAVNTMRGKFVDPGQRWAETDYPAVVIEDWVTEDGGPIEDTHDLRFVTSAYQAQRLANIALRRKRAGGALELTLNLRGYACRPGRVVRVNLPTLNIDGEFRVIDWDFHGDSGCKVTLQQEDPEIYDDAVGEPFNPLGFISLPTGGMAAPTGLAYTLLSIGEVIQGRLSWDAVGAAIHYNVVIKLDGVPVQSAQVPGGVTQCEIGGLEAGSYTAEVRARGQLGISSPATLSFNIATPPMPETVAVHVTNDTVTLIPRILQPGTPVQFEFRWSLSDMPLNEVEANAEFLTIGASLVHAGLSWGTTYHYWIRSVNAYGQSNWLYLTADTTEDFDDILAVIDEDIRRPGGLYDSVINEATTAAEQAASDAVDGVAQSLAELADDVESQFGEVDAGFAEVERVQQDAEWLEAIRHSAAIAKTAAASAYIRTEQVVRVDETSSLALQITSLNADYQDNKASVEQTLLAYADDISAVAQQTTALEASVGDEIARVDQELIAVYDDETGAVARAVTVAEVDGRKAVFGIQVDGTVAEIGGVADRFYILNPVGGEHVLAFVVEGGEVVIPDARIGRVTFTKLRAADGSLIFQNGQLQAQYIDVDNLVARQAQSNNFSAGNNGWRLLANGNAEFNQGVFRGQLSGANGTFSGVLTAQAVNAVDTINISGNAVSTLVSNYREFRLNFGGAGATEWTTIRELTYTSRGGDMLIIAAAALIRTVSAHSDAARIRIREDGNTLINIRTTSTTDHNNDDPVRRLETIPLQISRSPGTRTYTLEAQMGFESSSEVTRKRAMNILLSILERQR